MTADVTAKLQDEALDVIRFRGLPLAPMNIVTRP